MSGGSKRSSVSILAAVQAAAHTQAEAAKEAVDPLGHKYGNLPLIQSQQQTGRVWTDIEDLADSLEGQTVRNPQHNLLTNCSPHQRISCRFEKPTWNCRC